jgi:glycosyltransferase involved in cell wall biosynthesis
MATPKTTRLPLLIGPLTPPITGQSVAFSLLVEELARTREVRTVNLSELATRRDQMFTLTRTMQMLRLAASMFGTMRNVSSVYLTIAQSRLGFMRDALFIFIARLWNRPVIAHLHGGNYAQYYESEPPLMRMIIRSTLRRMERLVVLSDRLRADFAFLGDDFSSKLRSISNASPVPIGEPHIAPKGEVRLLYLSNLLAEKGYMDCLDALPHIMRLLPDFKVKLVLAGRPMLGEDEYESVGEMESTLRKHIRYLGLENVVELAGVVQGEAKAALLSTCHIHLLPTYYRNEGQPITVIEALTAGLPSVTTAWRGIVDLIDDEVTGLLVPPKDSIAIAEAVARLCNDPELYDRMSRAALESAGRFTRNHYVERITQLLDEVSAEPA